MKYINHTHENVERGNREHSERGEMINLQFPILMQHMNMLYRAHVQNKRNASIRVYIHIGIVFDSSPFD